MRLKIPSKILLISFLLVFLGNTSLRSNTKSLSTPTAQTNAQKIEQNTERIDTQQRISWAVGISGTFVAAGLGLLTWRTQKKQTEISQVQADYTYNSNLRSQLDVRAQKEIEMLIAQNEKLSLRVDKLEQENYQCMAEAAALQKKVHQMDLKFTEFSARGKYFDRLLKNAKRKYPTVDIGQFLEDLYSESFSENDSNTI